MDLTKRNLEPNTTVNKPNLKRHKTDKPIEKDNNLLKQQLTYLSRSRQEQGRETPIDRFFKIWFYLNKKILLEKEEEFQHKLKMPLSFFDSINDAKMKELLKEIEVS